MKYILVQSAESKPIVVMFSPEASHADIAQFFAGKILGAGFVNVEKPKLHVAGFSTSLGMGPTEIDAQVIAYDFHQTSRHYPAPQPETAASTYPWSDDIASLSPEDRAAVLATAAPIRCASCGEFIRDHSKEMGRIDRKQIFCATCSTLFGERAARSHTA